MQDPYHARSNYNYTLESLVNCLPKTLRRKKGTEIEKRKIYGDISTLRYMSTKIQERSSRDPKARPALTREAFMVTNTVPEISNHQ